MGRKAKFGTDVVKKGPGRKAKKQKDPNFPKHLTGITAFYLSCKCWCGIQILYIFSNKCHALVLS